MPAELTPYIGRHTCSEIDTAIDQASLVQTKQDALSESQMAAVNSGINSEKVAEISSNTAAIAQKVDKVAGKGLSTEDYTTAEKTQLAANTAAIAGKQDALSSAQLAAVNSGITASKVSSIDQKADAATTLVGYGISDVYIYNGTITIGSESITPITQHQDISGKVDKVQGKGLSTEDYTSAEKAQLAANTTAIAGKQNALTSTQLTAVNSGIDSEKVATISTTAAALNNKVDKVQGKGLSTEDYTTAEKAQLAALLSFTNATARIVNFYKYNTTTTKVQFVGSFNYDGTETTNVGFLVHRSESYNSIMSHDLASIDSSISVISSGTTAPVIADNNGGIYIRPFITIGGVHKYGDQIFTTYETAPDPPALQLNGRIIDQEIDDIDVM